MPSEPGLLADCLATCLVGASDHGHVQALESRMHHPEHPIHQARSVQRQSREYRTPILQRCASDPVIVTHGVLQSR